MCLLGSSREPRANKYGKWRGRREKAAADTHGPVAGWRCCGLEHVWLGHTLSWGSWLLAVAFACFKVCVCSRVVSLAGFPRLSSNQFAFIIVVVVFSMQTP